MWSGNRYDDERSRGRRSGSRSPRPDERWPEDEEFEEHGSRFAGGPDSGGEFGRGRGSAPDWRDEESRSHESQRMSPRYGPDQGYIYGARSEFGERDYGRASGRGSGDTRNRYEEEGRRSGMSGRWPSGGSYGQPESFDGTPANRRYDRDRETGRSWQGSPQADGWSIEPDEMQWNRQQGLYGSSEYAGHLSSQRSQSSYQSHVGKGPKGWQRSDERIREDVNEALARHPDIDASDIEVKVQSGEVTLSGTVGERRAKRMAEDVAERVFGVTDVQNQIRHQPAEQRGSPSEWDREVRRAPDREGPTGTDAQDKGRRGGAGTSATTG